MVNAGHLAELQGVDDQAHIAVRGEPHAVVLKGRFVAVAAAARMPADVKHPRQLLLRERVGKKQVARYIEAGLALEVQLFHRERVALQLTSHRGFERCLVRLWPQAEHIEVLPLQLVAASLPFLFRVGPRKNELANRDRLLGQIPLDRRIAGAWLSGDECQARGR